jgi:cytochrome c
MRKVFVTIAISAMLSACGGSDTANPSAENKDTTKTEAPKPEVNQAELDAGLTMIGSLGCTVCHSIDKLIVGPAYTEVAKKYEANPANIDTLSMKIIKGGSGVWGPTPMTPHPHISIDSARTMVKYILSLRNKQ